MSTTCRNTYRYPKTLLMTVKKDGKLLAATKNAALRLTFDRVDGGPPEVIIEINPDAETLASGRVRTEDRTNPRFAERVGDIARELGYEHPEGAPYPVSSRLDFIERHLRAGQACMGREGLLLQQMADMEAKHRQEIERLCEKCRGVERNTLLLKQRMEFYRNRAVIQRSLLRKIRQALHIPKGAVKLEALPRLAAELMSCHKALHTAYDKLREMANTTEVVVKADTTEAAEAVRGFREELEQQLRNGLGLSDEEMQILDVHLGDPYAQLAEDLKGVDYRSDEASPRKAAASPLLGAPYYGQKNGGRPDVLLTVKISLPEGQVLGKETQERIDRDLEKAARKIAERAGLIGPKEA